MKKREKRAIVFKKVEKPSFECEEIIEISNLFLPKSYFKIISFISEYYISSFSQAADLFIPFRDDQIPPKKESYLFSNLTLSKEQQKAYEFIKKNQISLLFGDTGSGKTEIYMKLFEDMVKEGKSSIFLLPEIALTPQMQKRLEERFKNRVAIWHSKISKKKKEEILEKIYKGETLIVAGARSALFLPLLNIGLIVVDEEHDESYKSNSAPRYNARDLAIYFGKHIGAKVLLGSATPSLGSYFRYPFFRLKGSYFKSKKKFIFERSESKITPLILEKIENTLKNSSQAIVFLPTRANFKYLICKNCSKAVECPYCSVGMSVHFDKNLMKCHYCGFSQRIPSFCPECKSLDLISQRIGTAEVAEELKKRFPDAKIQKFDRDEITSDRKLRKILKDFNEKRIDILVGTQMLSKGHDYHNISLAVILGIDNVLYTADYRAKEKALSLLFQIAGRSGRKEEGEVLIQTLNEDFFSKYIKDYELFLKEEINYRKDIYPPFVRLLRIIVSLKDEKEALKQAKKTLECLFQKKQKEVEIVGFAPALIYKISSKYRYNILLRSKSPTALIKTAMACKCRFCQMDMDPLHFV